MNWYLEVLKKYADFSGRARRKEYWYFVLFYYIFNVATNLLDAVLGTTNQDAGFGYISLTFTLAMIIPAFAVSVRRMHDVGKSGWFLLIPIYSFILAVTPGQVGPNEYGLDPKNPEAEMDITDHLV
jgi:uncharacterized membrane protein YhaH (DUF805 family)